MKKLLAKIGNIFKSLFNGAKKAYDNASPEEQEALRTATGITDLINKMLDEAPGKVRAAIQEKFPKLKVAQIEGFLFDIAEDIGLTKSDNLDELVDGIQKYLKSAVDIKWAKRSDTISKIIAVFLAPKGTKAATLLSLIVYVYHAYIKKDK